MSKVTVRIGFVPAYRNKIRFEAWAEQMYKESVAALSTVDGMELITPHPSPDGKTLDPEQGYTPYGGVNTLDEAEVVAEYFAAQKVDGIIICPLDFGDERSAVKVAEKLKVPILLYATKEPEAHLAPSLARKSDSYCGNLSLASGLYRRKLPFHWAGLFFPGEPELLEEVDTFIRAVAVVKGLMGARIGQVGVRTPFFETMAYDEVALIRKFEQNMIFTELSEITGRALSYADDDPRVLAVMQEVRGMFKEITVAKDYMLNAAKMELSIREFWEDNRLTAMAIQCWPSVQKLIGLSVCNIFGRLTNTAALTACEVDVLGSVAMMVNYFAALGETVPHFVDWTIQHRDNENWLMAWHCGNAPISLAADPSEATLRSRFNMEGAEMDEEGNPQAGLAQFQLKPGKVTFCRLVEYDDEWKMLITSGTIVPTNDVLAGTWAWVEVKDHKKLYRTLIEEGFIHHVSMVHGDQTKSLLQVCKFMDIKPVFLD